MQNNQVITNELYVFVKQVIHELRVALERWIKFAYRYDIQEGDLIRNYFKNLLANMEHYSAKNIADKEDLDFISHYLKLRQRYGEGSAKSSGMDNYYASLQDGINEYLITAKVYAEVLEFLTQCSSPDEVSSTLLDKAQRLYSQLQSLGEEPVTLSSNPTVIELVAAIEKMLPLLHECYLDARDAMLDDSYKLQSIATSIDLPANYHKTPYFALLSKQSQTEFKQAIGICAKFPPDAFLKLHAQVKALQECENRDNAYKGEITLSKLQTNITKVENILTCLSEPIQFPAIETSISFLAKSFSDVVSQIDKLPYLNTETSNLLQNAEATQQGRLRAKSQFTRVERTPSINMADKKIPAKSDIVANLYRKMSLTKRSSKALPLTEATPETELAKPLPTAAHSSRRLDTCVSSENSIKAKIRLFNAAAEQYKPVVEQLDQKFNVNTQQPD